MENNNIINVTKETTLRELIDMMKLGKKPYKTPTARKLRETMGDPIVETSDCLVYRNGYVVYENSSGRTVIWLPDCVRFTYYFNQVTEEEKGILQEKERLPEGLLDSLCWEMAVTLIGEHRIEANLLNRTGSRSGTKDYEIEADGDKNGDAEEAVDKSLAKEYVWVEDCIGETPETIYIRNETRQEMLERMTEKQREVFVMYYCDGYTENEISKKVGVSRDSVHDRLEGALKTMKKILKIF